MGRFFSIIAVLVLVFGISDDAKAEQHIELPPGLQEAFKKKAHRLGEEAKRLGLSARALSQSADEDELDLCQVALDVCTEKLRVCEACLGSWSGFFGALCMSECGAATGACDTAARVCAAGQ